MKEKEPFRFPKSLLNQIEECSNGGYTLFIFDSDGNPMIFSSFDSTPHSYAMQYFMENFVKATEAQNIEIALQSIDPEIDDEED